MALGRHDAARRRQGAACGLRPIARRAAALVLTGALAVSGLALAGCGQGSEGGSGAGDGTMTVAWTSNNGDYSLDPTNNYMGWQGSYLGIYEQLYRIDGSFAAQPMIAESAEQVAPDTWAFKIRDGVTFQNGDVVDAAAVKASLENAVANNPRAAKSLDAASIEADGQQLTITTNGPSPMLPNELCEPVFSVIDVAATDDPDLPVGSGPYRLASIDANGNAKLEAYDAYWQGAPATKHVSALYLTDDQSKVQALQSGEVQALMNVADDQLAAFEGNDAYAVHQSNQARAHMLYFNLRDSSVMSDEAVRQAVCLSLDRDSLVSSLYHGAAQPAHAVFPDGSGYADGVSQEGYDLEKAAQVLADDGWTDSDGDGILDKDGRPLSVDIVTYQANAALPKLCEVMSSTLGSLGFDVNIEVAEKIGDRLSQDGWDIGTMAYSTLPTGNPYTYLSTVMGSEGTANYGGFSDAQTDADLAALRASDDADERNALVRDIQQRALGEHAYCYVVHALVNDITASNVTNLAMQGQYDWLNWQMAVE